MNFLILFACCPVEEEEGEWTSFWGDGAEQTSGSQLRSNLSQIKPCLLFYVKKILCLESYSWAKGQNRKRILWNSLLRGLPNINCMKKAWSSWQKTSLPPSGIEVAWGRQLGDCSQPSMCDHKRLLWLQLQMPHLSSEVATQKDVYNNGFYDSELYFNDYSLLGRNGIHLSKKGKRSSVSRQSQFGEMGFKNWITWLGSKVVMLMPLLPLEEWAMPTRASLAASR